MAEAQAILERLGIDLDARAPASALSTGQRQMIEIARACAERPKVLILDEPTSSLGRAEEERLFEIIRRLRDDGVGHCLHHASHVRGVSRCPTASRCCATGGSY